MARALASTIAAAATVGACTTLAGLDSLQFGSATPAAGVGGAGQSGGTGGIETSGGAGGAPVRPWPPWLEGWAFRRPITVLEQPEPVASFPLPVQLAGDDHLAEHARSDGRDLRFTLADGTTTLAREVELYEPGDLAAWVRVPELGPEATLYLYYGNEGAPRADGTAVWQDGFAGVWHASDDLGTPPLLVRDATAAAHHGMPVAAGLTTDGGAHGRALDFDAPGDSVDIPDPADGSLDFGTSSFSLSCWVYVTTNNGEYDEPFSRGAGFELLLGVNDWRIQIGTGSVDWYAAFGDGSLFMRRWVHLAGVVDRQAGVLYGYADGVLRTQTALVGLTSLDEAASIRFNGNNPFIGLLDEARIYDHALSPAWIAAEHRALSTPGEVLVVGAPEAAP